MACTCIDEMDKLLAERTNTRIAPAIFLNGRPTAAVIATEVAQKKRGARAATLIATFCPFCGVAYGEAVAT